MATWNSEGPLCSAFLDVDVESPFDSAIKDRKIALLEKIRNVMKNIEIGKKSWKPLNTGFSLSTVTFTRILDTLLSGSGTDYILLNRFTQDALENVFS